MKIISESVLDDLDVRSTDSAAEVAASDSYQNTIHPSEYQYCLMLFWDDRMEDVLDIYTSRYSIYRMDYAEDVRRILKKIIIMSLSEEQVIKNIENRISYAFVEFDCETPWIPVLRLSGLSKRIYKLIPFERTNHTFIYVDKGKISPLLSENIQKLLNGENNKDTEKIINGIYKCCNNEIEHDEELENRVRDYVNKLDALIGMRAG